MMLGCGKKAAPKVVSGDKAEEAEVEDDGPKPAETIKKIKDKSPDKRMKGVEEAAKNKSPEMIAALLDALNDPSGSPLGDYYPDRAYSTREAATMALVQIGSEGEKSLLDTGLASLRNGLKDSDPSVKEHTAYAIAVLGSKAKPAANDLIVLAAAKEKEVRRAAYTALEKIRAVPAMPILQLLKNSDLEIRRDAAKTLTWLKPLPPEAVPIFMAVLQEDPASVKDTGINFYVRTTVAEALGRLGPSAKEAIPALIGVLKQTKEEELNLMQRPSDSGALLALQKIGKPAVPALMALLDDPSALVRWQAIQVLGNIGLDAKEALEPLKAAVDKEFQRSRGEFAIIADGVLAQISLGGDVSGAVAKISELLTNDRAGVRQGSVYVLGLIGPKAESAVPALIPLLDDADERVQLETAKTLRRIGPAAKAAIPALAKKLSDEEAKVRRVTAQTLRAFGPVAVAALPALIQLLSDPEENVRMAALETLKAIGPEATSAVAALAVQLKTAAPQEQLAVIELLGSFGPAAKPAMPELIALLPKKDPDLEEALLDCLGRIGPVESTVVPGVVAKLKSSSAATQIKAAKSLARMGAPAKSAADDLKKFGKTKDTPSEIWSAVALARMGIDPEANLTIIINAMQKGKNSSKPGLRKAALEAAEYLGPAGKAALPSLIEALKEKEPISKADDRQVRVLAITALGRMGALAQSVVPKLTDMLKENDDTLKRTIIEALATMGPSANFAAARLREIRRNDKNLAEEITNALEKIEGKAQ